jgi:hypothetical protein
MASLHPDVPVHTKTAGFSNNKASNYHWEQICLILKEASATGLAKGGINDAKPLFVKTILTAIAPDSGSNEQMPSLVDTSKYRTFLINNKAKVESGICKAKLSHCKSRLH